MSKLPAALNATVYKPPVFNDAILTQLLPEMLIGPAWGSAHYLLHMSQVRSISQTICRNKSWERAGEWSLESGAWGVEPGKGLGNGAWEVEPGKALGNGAWGVEPENEDMVTFFGWYTPRVFPS